MKSKLLLPRMGRDSNKKMMRHPTDIGNINVSIILLECFHFYYTIH